MYAPCLLMKRTAFFEKIKLSKYEEEVGRLLLLEIKKRLGYMVKVGLEYLTLDRMTRTLSGGEAQRVNLTTSLGSSLVNTLYILDEPSIGLTSERHKTPYQHTGTA